MTKDQAEAARKAVLSRRDDVTVSVVPRPGRKAGEFSLRFKQARCNGEASLSTIEDVEKFFQVKVDG